ncbi:histamine H2 receptor-like [Anneissia japonica]|uniref:histamine H2 receptor-like n=1 Tax=Anneissia japonica TaxID=1529436 RepID=UPI001425838E|nr:histamine H2 receptor-like [Anneissia japonica]
MNTTSVLDCAGESPVVNFTWNDTSEADRYILTNSYSKTDAFFITKVFPTILFFGVLNNGVFIFVLFRVHRMRTTLNSLLASLAISDTLFLALVIGEKTIRLRSSVFSNDLYPFSSAAYTILQSFIEMTFQASLIAITTVAYERYNRVCNSTVKTSSPIQKTHCGFQCVMQTHLVQLLAFIWGIGFLFSLLLLPSNVRYKRICIIWPPTENYTEYPSTILKQNIEGGMQIYYNISQGIPFVVAFLVNTYLYIQLVKTLKVHTKSVAKEHVDIFTKRRKRKQRITHMLLINSAVYFVCLAPYMLTRLLGGLVAIFNYDIASTLLLDDNAIFMNLCRTLMYLNSAINSILYTALSSIYRIAYMEAFCLSKPVTQDIRISELRCT